MLSAGTLTFSVAGTSTPLDTYSDVNLTTPNTNPVVLDSAGRAGPIFMSASSYKVILKTSAGVTIATRDHLLAVPTLTADVDIAGIAGEVITTGQLLFLSEGASGALTGGRWYVADADFARRSIDAGVLGFALSGGNTADPITVRVAGKMPGLVGLTAGNPYFVSATPGSLASAMPALARIVGVADTSTSLVLTPRPASLAIAKPGTMDVCQGRLTLATGVPVTITDQTAKTELLFTPYRGSSIGLYDSAASLWTVRTFSELSVAVPPTTSTMYDVFARLDANGVPVLSLLAWTNDTTRASALTSLNGVLVSAINNADRYLGSFRTTGVSGQTEDSFAKRYVWNYYNRVPRLLRVLETTNSWTYSTDTYQQANASAANQLDVVVGLAETPITVTLYAMSANSTGAVARSVAIGEDSTTAAVAGQLGKSPSANNQQLANQGIVHYVTYTGYPAIGRHFYTWLERATASGTTTWYGDAPPAGEFQAGLQGWMEG